MKKVGKRILLAVSAVLGLLSGYSVATNRGLGNPGLESVFRHFKRGELSPEEIAELSSRATVQIDALDSEGDAIASGTGFFTSRNGRIATNGHVIKGATSLRITTHNRDIYEQVALVSVDGLRDLAILRIPVDDAQFLALSRDSFPPLGASVYVMGNPLGQRNTFSSGIVSAVRQLEGVTLMQITAPISSGSSGGPVLNRKGEVVGVATLTLSGGQNLNYAVPARYLRPLSESTGAGEPFDQGLVLAMTPAWRRSADSQRESATRTTDTTAPPRRRERYVVTRMQEIARIFKESDYFPIGEAQFERLAEGESVTFTLERLREDGYYAITARCDLECADVDLRLYGKNDVKLAEDIREDDEPILVFTGKEYPDATAVEVRVERCSVAKCEIAVALFGGRRP